MEEVLSIDPVIAWTRIEIDEISETETKAAGIEVGIGIEIETGTIGIGVEIGIVVTETTAEKMDGMKIGEIEAAGTKSKYIFSS